MRYIQYFLLLLFLTYCETHKDTDNQLKVAGLQESVEVVRDPWGINHIYAKNQHDLFFAQGYAAARDRLFQFEIWRRQATGTVAELLGERELKRDIGTRLFKFRGNMQEEMNYYHEEGTEIITAYTDGVNAYIEEILKTPENLPIEFKMLGTLPQKWTPEVVISRHQGLLGNITQELDLGRAVERLEPQKVKELMWFHPKEPNITLDRDIDGELLFDDILDLYKAYRQSVKFQPEDILPEYRNTSTANVLSEEAPYANSYILDENRDWIGSNNWIVKGESTEDGNTYMANDPHRTIAVPSLRYMVHLNAPGWNVIGGGEPEIPGVSIGHNEYGAWGLTVFRTDGEDLYVYDLNPDNLQQYKYEDGWEDMEVIKEQIPIKDAASYEATFLYTRHGPVSYVDSTNLKAYAVRCAWMEPGGAPYLASLRMDQAKNWEEFRAACNYSHIPGENMIWADKAGNIGWQAVGIAPIRRNFSGLVPVPGDGRYEWDGYLPIIEKPHLYNPEEGFFGTANQSVTPDSYENWDAIGFTWSDPYRGNRVTQFLEENQPLNMEKMKALQTDVLSLPAQKLIPYIANLKFEPPYNQAVDMLLKWDYRLMPNSIEAGIYVAWEEKLKEMAHEQFVPETGKAHIRSLQLKRVIDWLEDPKLQFEGNAYARSAFMKRAFIAAYDELAEQLGDDISQWQYGQVDYKHTYIAHALSDVVNETTQEKLDAGPLPRGGNGYTTNSSGNNERQSSGASFRMIVNTGDWDATIGTNTPGQSGNPDSPYYKNLFESWANDEYFPVYFSKEKIDSVGVEKIVLNPVK